MKLMIYEWKKELGELPFAVLKATQEKVSLENLTQSDLLECNGKIEVVVSSGLDYVDTIRRSRDKTGIEMVHRWNLNCDGEPFQTLYPFDELKGYSKLDRMLRNYKM